MKVVISGIFYPMTMMEYFIRAFDRREDVELFLVGPYTETWIPWAGGMNLPAKYVRTPDLALPKNTINMHLHPQMIIDKLPWTPDLWVQIDAGWSFSDRPPGEIIVHVQTDPHVLKARYVLPKSYSDVNFCMQTPYMEAGEEYLAYAYDPYLHFPETVAKEYDACLIGLMYDHRTMLINCLKGKGYNVHYSIGEILDDNRRRYSKSKLALSWSSLRDTPTRVFEAFGMGLPLVANRTPDLANMFIEDVHYLGFDDVTEGVEKVEWALSNPDDAMDMAYDAHQIAKAKHTWDHRVKEIITYVGLI